MEQKDSELIGIELNVDTKQKLNEYCDQLEAFYNDPSHPDKHKPIPLDQRDETFYARVAQRDKLVIKIGQFIKTINPNSISSLLISAYLLSSSIAKQQIATQLIKHSKNTHYVNLLCYMLLKLKLKLKVNRHTLFPGGRG
eukprot:407413_1